MTIFLKTGLFLDFSGRLKNFRNFVNLNSFLFESFNYLEKYSTNILNEMTVEDGIKIICYSVWLSGSKLGLIPLKYMSLNNRFYLKPYLSMQKYRNLWYTFLVMSCAFTAFELYSSVMFSKTKNLVKITYQIFMLIIKSGAITCVYVFQIRPQEVAQLLNSFYEFDQNNFICSRHLLYRSKDTVFLFLLRSCTISVFCFYLFFTPAVALVVPCLHDNPITQLFTVNCSSKLFRIIIYVTQVACLLPIASIAAILTSVTLVTLDQITRIINQLW